MLVFELFGKYHYEQLSSVDSWIVTHDFHFFFKYHNYSFRYLLYNIR